MFYLFCITNEPATQHLWANDDYDTRIFSVEINSLTDKPVCSNKNNNNDGNNDNIFPSVDCRDCVNQQFWKPAQKLRFSV